MSYANGRAGYRDGTASGEAGYQSYLIDQQNQARSNMTNEWIDAAVAHNAARAAAEANAYQSAMYSSPSSSTASVSRAPLSPAALSFEAFVFKLAFLVAIGTSLFFGWLAFSFARPWAEEAVWRYAITSFTETHLQLAAGAAATLLWLSISLHKGAIFNLGVLAIIIWIWWR